MDLPVSAMYILPHTSQLHSYTTLLTCVKRVIRADHSIPYRETCLGVQPNVMCLECPQESICDTFHIYGSTANCLLLFSSPGSNHCCVSGSGSFLNLVFPLCSPSLRAHSGYPQFLRASITFSFSLPLLPSSEISVVARCMSVRMMPSFCCTR